MASFTIWNIKLCKANFGGCFEKIVEAVRKMSVERSRNHNLLAAADNTLQLVFVLCSLPLDEDAR